MTKTAIKSKRTAKQQYPDPAGISSAMLAALKEFNRCGLANREVKAIIAAAEAYGITSDCC